MNERWPKLLGRPEASGRIREKPEDFQVQEIPAYTPSGSGEHLMIEIEKTGLATDQVVRCLADHLGLAPREVGTAGLKDRHAVTRQWLSVPARVQAKLDSFDHPAIRVLAADLHPNKLKTGHLRGNRFLIRVRDPAGVDRARLQERVDALIEKGVPNYFGPQRFGPGGRNEAEGLSALAGKSRKRGRQLRFLLSAVQSALFNDLLALRIQADLFTTVLRGDLLIKVDTGGRFECEDPGEDQARADRLKVHPSGPMYGPKMKSPAGEPAEMERRVLEGAELTEADFTRYKKLTQGTRRALRMVAFELRLEFEDDALKLGFGLPAGGYATAVLSELLRTDEADQT
jgi:tRNA pseudouridine13 synthase